jgi:hypothetical protein
MNNFFSSKYNNSSAKLYQVISPTGRRASTPNDSTERAGVALGGAAKLAASLAIALGVMSAGSMVRADALSTPSMTAPLAANADPAAFNWTPIGKVYVTGQVTGLGLGQTAPAASPYAGNNASLFDLGNAQIELQTTTGPVQFYVQLGAYSLPSLGAPYVPAGRTTKETFGAAPIGYLKLVPNPDVSVQIGALPTLIGAEYTFTFQNMNIERGLLWNQEPATSRGVQVNYSHGPLLLSASVNDGFYSGRYTTGSGLASYTFDSANTVVVAGGANFARVGASSYVTPLAQNNSSQVDLIYTYFRGPLTINPYLQYTKVDAAPGIGLMTSASTSSGAVLAKYNFNSHWSLAARTEYVRSARHSCTAAAACTPTNLLYGPRSTAWSNTLTPTYQKGCYFGRAEVSTTRIGALAAGYGFGRSGQNAGQRRALVEVGVLF